MNNEKKNREEGLLNATLEELLNDKTIDQDTTKALKEIIDFMNENGAELNIFKRTDNETNSYYYIVNLRARLGGVMYFSDIDSVKIPLAKGNMTVSSRSCGVLIDMERSGDKHKFVKLKGCANVKRDKNHAIIKLIVGDRLCTTILSDGMSEFGSGPLFF